MSGRAADFTGSIPSFYDQGLGPIFFAEFADDIARRVAASAPTRVLELAAGTGIVTRRVRDLLPQEAQLIATDLNSPMLEVARRKFRPDEMVEFQTADATALPFPDASFDAVVCQFEVMFFPDKDKGHCEAHRVLASGADTCSAFGTRTGTTHSAESRMRLLVASSLPIRRSFTTCRSPITGSIPLRNR
jgi:ubiquinone/menaquinone biosynthesis C-methylase UbiE